MRAMAHTVHAKAARRKVQRRGNNDDGEGQPFLNDQTEATTRERRLRFTPSMLLPNPNSAQITFFQLVRAGQLEEVAEFLHKQPEFNLNCRNICGRTPLVIAVRNGDMEMVAFLLSFSQVQIGDAVMHAVQKGDVSMIIKLLDRAQLSEESILPPPGSEFAAVLTPLVLAAHCNNYEVVGLLLSRGHAIHKPHPPSCFCEEQCHTRKAGEGLSESMARYNAYKAISSPSYICHTAEDPILTAFHFSEELRGCSNVEREFKNEYLALAATCSRFAVDVLAHTRTTEEVNLLLNESKGVEKLNQAFKKYVRVALAIQLDQKQFVAHPHCQQVMRKAWLEGWQDWQSLSFFSKVCRLLPRVFLLPLMAIVYWIIPRSEFVRTWRMPLNKFFSFGASYAFFLILIMIQCGLKTSKDYRGMPFIGIEWYILVYVLGLFWMNIKTLFAYGPRQYVKQPWNVVDLVMVSVFLASFGCWIWSLCDLWLHGSTTLSTPRYMWDQYDPVLIAEALYAYAVVLAFAKLLFFFQIGQSFGPLQASMSRMIVDIAAFMIVFVLLVLAFALGLYSMYSNYGGQFRMVDGSKIEQNSAFTSFGKSVYTLYWAIYGYSPPNLGAIVTSQYVVNKGNKTVTMENNHHFTEVMGLSMLAIFYITGIVILVNMLIAILSDSFANVQENADSEWKFARTKVWMSFFAAGGTMPPPFNLVPTPKTFYDFGRWCAHMWDKESKSKWSIGRCCYVEKDKPDKVASEGEYKVLMSRLIQRYLIAKGRLEEDQPATEGQLVLLKQQVHDVQSRTRDLSRTSLAAEGSMTRDLSRTSLAAEGSMTRDLSRTSLAAEGSMTRDLSRTSLAAEGSMRRDLSRTS